MNRKIFYEDVHEKMGDRVLHSTIRVASTEDVNEAEKLHKLGKCPHTIVYDQYGFPYDFRKCHTCGKELGAV